MKFGDLAHMSMVASPMRARYGAQEVVIVNGLGGNLPALIERAKEHARACVSMGTYFHFGIYQKTK